MSSSPPCGKASGRATSLFKLRGPRSGEAVCPLVAWRFYLIAARTVAQTMALLIAFSTVLLVGVCGRLAGSRYIMTTNHWVVFTVDDLGVELRKIGNTEGMGRRHIAFPAGRTAVKVAVTSLSN